MADKKNINPRRPIPSDGYDRLRQNLESGFAEGFPVENFPNPDNRPNVNRGRQTSRKEDKTQDISIGLQDHDEAIMYYFNEVIKPSVIVNGNRTKVPVIYGAPERWKGVQKYGFYRDKEGKIQVPLIMFKRDSVEKRRDLGNKLDGNNPQLYYTFQEKYTKRNQYDNFSVLQNRRPQKEFHAIVVPDFIKLTYSCVIWCDYVAQMNKLIEMINYTSDSYWGNPERFKFNAKIDTYNNTTEISQGDNRIVKTNFGLTLQGYLVPESLNKDLNKKPQKFFSKSTIVFKDEIEVTPTGGWDMESPYQYKDEVEDPRDKARESIRKKQVIPPAGESGGTPPPEGIGYDEVGEVETESAGIGAGTNASDNTTQVAQTGFDEEGDSNMPVTGDAQFQMTFKFLPAYIVQMNSVPLSGIIEIGIEPMGLYDYPNNIFIQFEEEDQYWELYGWGSFGDENGVFDQSYVNNTYSASELNDLITAGLNESDASSYYFDAGPNYIMQPKFTDGVATHFVFIIDLFSANDFVNLINGIFEGRAFATTEQTMGAGIDSSYHSITITHLNANGSTENELLNNNYVHFDTITFNNYLNNDYNPTTLETGYNQFFIPE